MRPVVNAESALLLKQHAAERGIPIGDLVDSCIRLALDPRLKNFLDGTPIPSQTAPEGDPMRLQLDPSLDPRLERLARSRDFESKTEALNYLVDYGLKRLDALDRYNKKQAKVPAKKRA